jgi:predicted O-methyltransferase YrrM
MLWLACATSLVLAVAQDAGTPPDRNARPPNRDAAGGRGPRGGPSAGRSAGRDFESTPQAKDEAEKKILEVLNDMSRAGRGMMSVPRDDGRLLRMLAESIGAKNVVELGTSQGYSALWMCLALRTTGGKLTTFEINSERAALARQNFERAGVQSLVTVVVGDAHKELGQVKDPVDLVFIDADKEGYADYLNQLLPRVRGGGLIVAHNITPGMADPTFIQAATTNVNLETLFLNTGNSGISVSMKKR